MGAQVRAHGSPSGSSNGSPRGPRWEPRWEPTGAQLGAQVVVVVVVVVVAVVDQGVVDRYIRRHDWTQRIVIAIPDKSFESSHGKNHIIESEATSRDSLPSSSAPTGSGSVGKRKNRSTADKEETTPLKKANKIENSEDHPVQVKATNVWRDIMGLKNTINQTYGSAQGILQQMKTAAPWMEKLEEPARLRGMLERIDAILKEGFWHNVTMFTNIAELKKTHSEHVAQEQLDTTGKELRELIKHANQNANVMKALQKAKSS